MNGLDFIFLGIIILGGLVGGKIGFFRALSSLLGFILAALLSRWTAPYVLESMSVFKLDEKIGTWIEETTEVNKWQAKFQLWAGSPEANAVFTQPRIDGAADFFGQHTNIAHAAAQIILFIAISITLFFIYKLLLTLGFKFLAKFSNKIPLHKKLDTLGGIVWGSLAATIIGTIALVIWIPLSMSLDVTNKSFLNTNESIAVKMLISAISIDDYLPLDMATHSIAPMMAESNPSAEQMNGTFNHESIYEEHNRMQNELLTLEQWFGSAPKTYEEKELSATVDCKSGDCPDWEIEQDIQILDCWFCNSEWVGIQDDFFYISSDGSYSADTLAGCTTKIEGPILSKMKISQMTDELLVVQGPKVLHKSQSGQCEIEYEATIEITTEWRF